MTLFRALHPTTNRYHELGDVDRAILDCLPATQREIQEATGLEPRQVTKILDRRLRPFVYWVWERPAPTVDKQGFRAKRRHRVYHAAPKLSKNWPQLGPRLVSDLIEKWRQYQVTTLEAGDLEKFIQTHKVLADLHRAMYLHLTWQLHNEVQSPAAPDLPGTQDESE